MPNELLANNLQVKLINSKENNMTKILEIRDAISSYYEQEKKEQIQPGLVFKAIDSLKRPNRFIIEIDSDEELRQLIALHVAGSHAPKNLELSVNELFNPSSMKGQVPKKDVESISSLMRMVATHLPKHNEAIVNGDNVFSIKGEASNWGVCSLNADTDNINISKRLAFSGNAAVAPKKFLYALDFILAGKRTSFIEEIASQNSVIVEALCDSGFDIESVSEMRSTALDMLACGTPSVVEGNQILWFVGDDEYHAISPVPSAQMIADLNESIKTRREDSYLPLIRKSVGGTKPLNASDLNALIGSGSSQVLSVDLSFMNKWQTQLERMITRKKPLIGTVSLADVGLDVVRDLKKKKAENYRNSIAELMLMSLTRVLEFKSLVQNGLYDIDDLSVKEERLFMLPFSSQSDLALCSKYLVKVIVEAYNKQKIEINEVMQKEIETAASIIIERIS